jgi:hypothetical protein
MNAPSVPVADQDCPAQAIINTGLTSMSPRKFSAKTAKREYRRSFPAKWQQFMISEFESPAHAAFEFGCDPSTAEGWFEGSHAPSGPFVGYAYSRWPERVAAFLQEKFA